MAANHDVHGDQCCKHMAFGEYYLESCQSVFRLLRHHVPFDSPSDLMFDITCLDSYQRPSNHSNATFPVQCL